MALTDTSAPVWHMEYNSRTGAGSWEKVPVRAGYAVYGIELTSTDLDTFEIMENLGGTVVDLYQSSSPGNWINLFVPQGFVSCLISGALFTSPVPGSIKLWVSKNSEVYTDLYGPSPVTSPGLQLCQ